MDTYKDEAIKIVEKFKIDLKKIKIDDFESNHSFNISCYDLLDRARIDFNQSCLKKNFGDISFSTYKSCLNLFSEGQLYLEKYLESH